MHGEFKTFLTGVVVAEEHILGGQHGFATHEVGIHTLPSARQGAAVENHLQSVAVGIREDILVELHGLLLVAAEEVNLDALHADALHPFHLAFACHGGIHAVSGSLRGIVPEAIAVIP